MLQSAVSFHFGRPLQPRCGHPDRQRSGELLQRLFLDARANALEAGVVRECLRRLSHQIGMRKHRMCLSVDRFRQGHNPQLMAYEKGLVLTLLIGLTERKLLARGGSQHGERHRELARFDRRQQRRALRKGAQLLHNAAQDLHR